MLGAFAALGAGATAVVFGVLLVRGLPAVASSDSTSLASSNAPVTPAAPASSAPAGFPAPPRGAVVFGAEAGVNALGLAVVPAQGKIVLQASVVDIQGKGVKGLSVRFEVAGTSGQKTTASATPCGNGCYRATVGIRRPLSVDVQLSGPRHVSFAMPAAWPPPPAARIVRLADAAWRKLHSLAYHDSLGDGTFVLETDWKIVSPNRIEFNIQNNLGAGIIIGDRRWDKVRGGTRWLAAPQLPVHQPVPFWQSATNVHLLGTVLSGGRPAWKVSFFDSPGGPGWFTILVDKATLHTTELWMTAAGHFHARDLQLVQRADHNLAALVAGLEEGYLPWVMNATRSSI